MKPIKNAVLAAAILAFGAAALPAPVLAGEGHWSIGKGVQCRLIAGKVVCTKNRP